MFSGAKGNGFQANGVPIQQPTTPEQAQQLFNQSQSGLQQQQNFVNALTGQNGIQNQSNVYNQLQGVANGQGPNPAQAMLSQATGQNVQNQAALMAGQRGSGSNAGLIARQAAIQGANTQQQAAGQAATLQANQSLGALNQLGGIAGQQVGQQAGAVQNLNQNFQNEQSNVLSAIQGQNNSNVAMQSNINNANAGIAGINAAAQNKMTGSLINSAGGAAAGLLAQGGMVRKPYAEGGAVGARSSFGRSLGGDFMPNIGNAPVMPAVDQTPETWAGKAKTPMSDSLKTPQMGSQFAGPGYDLGSAGSPGAVAPAAGPGLGVDLSLASTPAAAALAQGGRVPALVSPGEVYLNPKAVKEASKGKDPIKAGEKIPGKAKVKGNSYANDTVPKELEEGGIVLPKSVMEAKHPHWEAHKFVSAILKEKALKGKR